MKRPITLALALATAFGTLTAARGQDPDFHLERARTFSDWFLSGNHEQLWSHLSDPMRELTAGPEAFASMKRHLGAQDSLVSETLLRVLGAYEYSRIARFTNVESDVIIQWVFDDDGTIHGALVRPVSPPAESRYLDYQTQARLMLPFEGEWHVYWGGRSVVENYHAVAVDQRFAYDFVIAIDGSTHVEDGSRNEHYHCFGEQILAPGRGVVLVAQDGIPDNTPGTMDALNPPGNHVVIDHGNDEYSFLAHLMQGSLQVNDGDQVEQGQLIALCGNSGHSSEPHLHYHLQNNPVFGKGEGLPAQFQDYVADGVRVSRGEPSRGARIRSMDENTSRTE